ncbi:MAG: ATP-binding protein [Pseudomonadota bacterium]
MKAKFLLRTFFRQVDPLSGTNIIKKDLLDNGFIVVLDGGNYKGILTPKDIIKSPRNLVLDCIQARPVIQHDQQIDVVLNLMKDSGFVILPVFRDKNFVGVILQSDITEYLAEYNNELECVVKEHTAELEEINKKLIKEIEDREKAEKEHHDLMAQMHQSEKMMAIGTLAGGIAHDFNNILSPIIGFTEIALGGQERGSPLWENLNEIYSAGKRAKELVSRIMTYTHKTEETTESVQMAAILEEGLKLLQSVIPSSIEIKQLIETDSYINANQTKIHQIYLNLCTNAYHAMEKSGGILEIRLTEVEFQPNSINLPRDIFPGKYVKLSVSDNGTGIRSDIIDKVFDPYFTTKETGKGSGMGLSIVYGIVKSFGGTINVESQFGKGSTFSVYFPVLDIKIKEKRLDSGDGNIQRGTERILFIDDEIAIANLNKQLLERIGYTVEAITDPKQALELFQTRSENFDLVITDMTMPGISGDMLTLELLKIRPDIPVILCTGYNNMISEDKALKLGIRAFVYKPVLYSDLSKIIRKVLDEAKFSSHVQLNPKRY